jgi:voltage-gated potassium channel
MVPHVRAPVRFLMYLRFARYLFWEFRWPLGIFSTLVLVGGLILHLCYDYDHGRLPFAHACHAVFLMIFLESSLDFPTEWYLQPLFFLLPIAGLGAVADSLVRLAYLAFTRKQNLPEWNRMLASLCRNHFVVIGVGKVGYQVIRLLLELHESVVAIEMASGSPLLGELFDKGVPVIQGNARQSSVLDQAGVRQAKAVIVTTSDDLTNLDAAITARELNKDAKIVIRLFDETLATKVAGAFSMPTISTSHVAAPAFIAAATGRKIYQGFQLAGQYVHFTDMTICPTSRLVGLSVGEVQADKRINIVMQQGAGGVNVNPDPEIVLEPGDTILVIAPMEALLTLESMNQAHESTARSNNRVKVATKIQAEDAGGSPPSEAVLM